MAQTPRYALHRTSQPISGSSGILVGQDNAATGPSVRFAAFRLEADGSLFRGSSLIHLPPKELAALRLLLAKAGQVVTAAELMQALWGEVNVTAESVPKCLSSLRARLQPDDCIQTVYKRGYRLMADAPSPEGTSAPALPRLAIPPFSRHGSVPEHLGTAVAEETIFRLSNAEHPTAAILARDSVFTLATRGFTAQQIGEALHADLVMAGTLSALNSRLRLRVEMIRVHDGVQIWVEDLLVEWNRIVGLESDLVRRLDFRLKSNSVFATKLVDQPAALKAHAGVGAQMQKAASESILSPSRKGTSFSISAAAGPSRESISDTRRREAYDTFLRGRHEWQTLERHRMQDGLRHLTRATELDPSLISAKVDLVRLCVTQAFYGYMPPTVAANLARRTAESVPNLPHQAPAMLPSLGWLTFHVDRNLPAALWDFNRSAHLPHDIFTTRERSQFALSRHRFDEAEEVMRSALDQDPYAPWLHARMAWTLHLAGQAEASVDTIRRGLALFPKHDGMSFYGSIILAFDGDTAEGLQLAESVVQLQPHIDLLKAVHAYALARAGREAEAREILDRLRWLSQERFVLGSFTPAVHVALGDYDAAMASLKSANAAKCPWFFQMLADPRLAPLRDRDEFQQLNGLIGEMERSAAKAESPH